MTAEQRVETEEMRTGIVNSLHDIYTRPDRVVCLDVLLLCLYSASMIDVAVFLYLSR